jgi:[acyl-carrier-protein] S-malonyltransferase
VAGHSLGEYCALCAAGAFDVAAGAKLLRRRGGLMGAAVPAGAGAMAAVIGDVDICGICAAAAAAVGGICENANDNAPGQSVISGNRAAVEKAVELAKNAGAKIAKLLPVPVPAHCSLMTPAADEFALILENIGLEAPAVPFVSNRTAAVMTDPAEIKNALVYQMTHGVRWRESVLGMPAMGIDEIVEVGPGNILTGLCRRIAPELNCHKLDCQCGEVNSQ